MARTTSQRLALHAVVLALAARRSAVVAQTFVTSLVGLGGTPVGLTPLNTVGASVMSLYSLASVDPDAVCNGAPQATTSRASAVAAAAGGARRSWHGNTPAHTATAARGAHAPLSPRLASPHPRPTDGTPAGYYFAPGTGSGCVAPVLLLCLLCCADCPSCRRATQWLVYLEGSMFCWDGLSCHGASARAPACLRAPFSDPGWNSLPQSVTAAASTG